MVARVKRSSIKVPESSAKAAASGGGRVKKQSAKPSALHAVGRPSESRTAMIQVPKVVPKPGQSLVNCTVDTLRHAVLTAGSPSEFLGSETELIERLGVSRPTFRQATKLLCHENLLVIKRGVGGGFFTQAPSIDAVSRLAAVYLNAQKTSLRQLNDAVSPLLTEAARLLAQHADADRRGELAAFVARCEDPRAPESRLDPVRRLLAFEELLAELAGNPAICLMTSVMRDLARATRHRYFKITPDRAVSYQVFQARLAAAIEEGDAEVATLICDRQFSEIRAWLPADEVSLSVGR